MEKIIAALMGLLFTFAVVGTAIASGEPTSCDRWWYSYYEGKYVASSYDGYSPDEKDDDHYYEKDDDHYYEKDGYSSDSHDGYHSYEKDD
jgi:hypothetical protein